MSEGKIEGMATATLVSLVTRRLANQFEHTEAQPIPRKHDFSTGC